MTKHHVFRVLKRPAVMLLALVLLLTLLPLPAVAIDYTGHWAQGSIDRAVQMGWFADASNTRPNESITRAEFVVMVNRMKGFSGTADLSGFTDITESDWYYGAFAVAVAQGYIQGANGKLNPNARITRNEAVAILVRISGLDTDGTNGYLTNVSDVGGIPEWASPYADAAIGAGLVAGSNGSFNGSANITRAETAVLLERLYDGIRTYGFAGTYTGDAGGVIIAAAGVTLKDANISGDLTIAASVGDGEVTLSGVKIGGRLDVQGGGRNSVYLEDCEIASIVVTKDEVRVVFADGTTATYANVEGSNSSIVIANGATVDNITVESDAAGANIVIENGASVDNVTISAPNTNINVESGATVSTMTVEAPNSNVNLASDATVNTLTVAAAAEGSLIATESGAKIGTANIEAAGTELTGGAAIAVANVKAADVVIESKPAATNVDSGLTANVGGSSVSGTTSGTTSGGDSGGSTGGGTATGNITGTITAKQGDTKDPAATPLAGAVITVDATNETATTNASGVFTISGIALASGKSITVTAPGYAAGKKTGLNVTAGGSTNAGTITLKSTSAKLFSSSADIIAGASAITVADGTNVDDLRAALYVQHGGTFKIMDSGDAEQTTGTTAIEDGWKIVAAAEDGIETKTYTIDVTNIKQPSLDAISGIRVDLTDTTQIDTRLAQTTKLTFALQTATNKIYVSQAKTEDIPSTWEAGDTFSDTDSYYECNQDDETDSQSLDVKLDVKLAEGEGKYVVIETTSETKIVRASVIDVPADKIAKIIKISNTSDTPVKAYAFGQPSDGKVIEQDISKANSPHFILLPSSDTKAYITFYSETNDTKENIPTKGSQTDAKKIEYTAGVAEVAISDDEWYSIIPPIPRCAVIDISKIEDINTEENTIKMQFDIDGCVGVDGDVTYQITPKDCERLDYELDNVEGKRIFTFSDSENPEIEKITINSDATIAADWTGVPVEVTADCELTVSGKVGDLKLSNGISLELVGNGTSEFTIANGTEDESVTITLTGCTISTKVYAAADAAGSGVWVSGEKYKWTALSGKDTPDAGWVLDSSS